MNVVNKTLKGPPQIAEVSGLNDDGRGVARIDGKVVFIDGALPGEEVVFCVEKRRRSYDRGRVLEVRRASPERVAPRCRYFGVCGGCGLQHLEAAAQIREKEQILRDKLRQFGRLEPERWLAPLTGPAWGYRRSARLGVRDVPKKGGILVGFRERASRYITSLEDCLTLDPRLAALLPALHRLVAGLSCRNRIPQIEAVCGDDEAALVVRHLEPLNDPDRAALAEFGARHGVRIYLQPAGPDSVTPLWPEAPGPLRYRLPEFDVTISFQPTHFIQVNAALNRAMVAQAVALLDPGPGDTVLDLFCGLGNFTLPLARRAGRVVGVEAEGALLRAARGNSEANGIANTEFLQADLGRDEDARALWARAAPDGLLLDPPRSGAIEALKQLPERGPARIVYVSCQPATLARDAEYLVHARGYRLTQAGVMDMFPQTNHVESVAVFERGRGR